MNGFCKFYAQKCKFSIFSAPQLPIYYNKGTRTLALRRQPLPTLARHHSPTLAPPLTSSSPNPTRRPSCAPFLAIFREIKK